MARRSESKSDRAASRRPVARFAAGAALVVGLVCGGFGQTARAHDDIVGSTPADRSVIDEPISTAEIDFGEEISEEVELFLTYEPGDGTITDIGGETVKTGPTTARLDFPELEQEGTYFLRYLAPVPVDGHVLIGVISFTWGEPTAIDDGDDDVRRASPASRSRIDAPISEATIEFDVAVEDDIELTLVYDRGDGANFDEIEGETTLVDERTARLTFDELERQGTYFIRYFGTKVDNGDEVVGATSFVWGEPSSRESGFPVLAFLAVSIPILAIGAWASLRRARRGEPDVDDTASTSNTEPDTDTVTVGADD